MNPNLFDLPFRLVSLRTQIHHLPLVAPIHTAAATFRQREVVIVEALIRIDGRDHRGCGEASPLAGWSLHSVPEVADQAANARMSGALLSLAELHHAPKQPLIPELEYAVAMAVLDAMATREQRSVAHLLASQRGIYPQSEVPVQCTLGCSETAATLRAVDQACQRGFSTVKLKVGAGPLELDIARIKQVAEAFPQLEIRLDANAGWDVDQAMQALEAMPVSLIEQPVPPGRLLELLQRRGAPWPLIAADESCSDPESALQLIEDGRIDALVVKPCTLGSPVRILELLALARRRGIDVIFSNLMESAIGRAGAAALAAAWPEFPGPHGLATAGWFAQDLAPPEPVHNGLLQLATRADDAPWRALGIAP
ncbi:MAG: o-succinylbenzoate synthase [Wenzhouxiangellaceae bacterium]